MLPFNNLQDQSIYAKLQILIEKMACVGCGVDATSGNGGSGIDAGMKQLLIKAIERLSCHNCGGE